MIKILIIVAIFLWLSKPKSYVRERPAPKTNPPGVRQVNFRRRE